MRAIPVLLALLLLAGCADPGAPAAEAKLSSSPSSTATAAPIVPGVDPGLPLGSIKGRILGDEQLPLAGIAVTLVGFNVSATTDAQGQFFFNRVNVGEYFLVARGPGYRERQLGVQVTEGSTVEVSLILESIPRPVPRVEPYLFRKSINCATSARTPATGGDAVEPSLSALDLAWTQRAQMASDPCPLNVILGEEYARNSTGEIQTQPGLVGALFEAKWTPTTDGSQALRLNVSLQPIGAGSGFDVEGTSPLWTSKNSTGLRDYRQQTSRHNDYAAQAGRIRYSLDVAPSMTGEDVDVGFAVDQNVDVAITLFYVVDPADYATFRQYQ